MRPALVIGGAACASAVAVWLSGASVHIVRWDEEGPQRVGVFAPLWQLALALGLSGAAAGLFWIAMDPETRDARARILAPLTLLVVLIVPFLPWLPDRVPLLLVLAGPVRWLFVSGAVGAALVRVPIVSRAVRTWARVPGRRFVFTVSLAFYLVFGLRSLATVGLKGDEPHYLIISQSLLADGDLEIENNHRRREYRAFTREELPPDYMQRGQNGEIYSIHAPGLPALLLPVYALAGAHGALAVLCATGGLAALGVFELAALVAGHGVALITWAAIALTVPFVPYAWSIFPEMPGAAIAAWAAVWIVSGRTASRAAWAARGVALALLPWLHTKLVVLEAALGVLLMWRQRRNKTAVLALAVPIALSAASWFGFFYVVYGTASPEAPYGTYAREWVRLAFVPRGLLGLLFDQKFGLLTYAPVYTLVVLGTWTAMRHATARWTTLTLTATAAAFAISSARLYMWWGGWSAPARFLVPALPLAAPAMALAIDRARHSAWGRGLVAALLAISIAAALAGAAVPERLLLYSEAHGVSRMADAIQGSAPLAATLPMFTESEWEPQDLIPRRYLAADRRAAVVRGRSALLETADPRRIAFDYATGRRLGPIEWRAMGTLTPDVVPSTGAPPLPPTGIFPEGGTFWTMGTQSGRVYISPRGHRAIDVTVHIGPTGGVCEVAVNGDSRIERFGPNETRVLAFDGIPTSAAWVPLTVRASHAFRPADVNPESGDVRLLGCQVGWALR